VKELENSEDESEFEKVKKLVKKLKEDEDIRTIEKINLMLKRGYKLEEIETNGLIRDILINNEIDMQELRKS